MLTTPKVGRFSPRSWLFPLLLALLCGCQEPGPRALLKGERYLREQQYHKALEQLLQGVRLLPNHAQAWNHLGLAYHGLKQHQHALQSYHNALLLNHKLAAARFNLGCLLLEENQLETAIEELTSFTMLQPGSIQGWLQLGKAQSRADQFNAAEESFKVVLELEPHQPEALNDLGVLQLRRRRPAEAMHYFTQALTHHPEYAPAHYNAAVLTYQHLKNASLALKKFQQYLDLDPRPTNWTEVASLVSRLERTLHPIALNSAAEDGKNASLLAQQTGSGPKWNPVSPPDSSRGSVSPNGGATPQIAAAPKPPPSLLNSTPQAETARAASKQGTVAPAPAPTASADNSTREKTAEKKMVSTPPPILIAHSPEKPSAPPIQEARPNPQTPPSTLLRPPSGAIAPTTEDEGNRSAATAKRDTTSESPGATTENESLLRPLTPSPIQQEPAPDRPTLSAPSPANARTVSVARAGSNVDTANSQAGSESASPGSRTTRSIPGYQYRHPVAGPAGDRGKAEPFFKEGLRWHRAGRQAFAIERYQQAVQADPSYFEAYFNMGVAAFETADWQLSLASYEMALALNADSVDAHFNFCMALQRANYPMDALRELRRLLRKHPEQARIHLALGNLYDQVFRDPDKAREHYRRVVELDPRHPEAQKIRMWLSANR